MKDGLNTVCDICGKKIFQSSSMHRKRVQSLRLEMDNPELDACDECIESYWDKKMADDLMDAFKKHTKSYDAMEKVFGSEAATHKVIEDAVKSVKR